MSFSIASADFVRQHDLVGRDTRVVAALSGGSDSVALVHIAARARRRRRAASRRPRAFQPSAPRSRRTRRAFAAALAARSACRSRRTRGRGGARIARTAVARGCGARRAPRLFRARPRRIAARTSSLSAIRATIRPRPSLCACCAAPASRGLAGMHPRNGFIVRPLLDCRRKELRAGLAERAASVRRGRDQPDVAHPAQPRPRRAAAAARSAVQSDIVEMLATEAEIARDDVAVDGGESADALAAHVSVMEPPRATGSHAVEHRPACDRAAGACTDASLWRAMIEAAGRPLAFPTMLPPRCV